MNTTTQPLFDFEEITAVLNKSMDVTSLSDERLVELLGEMNQAYRAGEPIVSDAEYDHVFLADLKRRNPDHPFLNTVEPEPEDLFSGSDVRHAKPMLSTLKCYTDEEISAFCRRVRQAAKEIGLSESEILIDSTCKLDGLAGFDYGDVLATRGDGHKGQDISVAFERGVVPVGGRGQGAGEIIVVESFFQSELKQQYGLKHGRNYMVGLIAADTIKPHHTKGVEAGACRFVPYSTLPVVTVPLSVFEEKYRSIADELEHGLDYLCDGTVARVRDEILFEHMGATSHHHRGMVAIKEVGETAETRINSITLQTGRTGRITPVCELEPVHLSGAEIRRATAHTGRMVEKLRLGAGAVVKIVRSGEVIPKLLECLEPSNEPVDMSQCPSCGGETEWDGEYLVCPHEDTCPAQASRAIEHFFKTIGVCDGFGPSACNLLTEAGITRISQIYQMGQGMLVSAGFGEGQAKNLVSELERSLREPIRENLFLGAWGLSHLGRGDSRRLLEVYDFEQLGTITEEQVSAIPGFGEKTSGLIAAALRQRWDEISQVRALGFNLESVKQAAVAVSDSAISGKKFVFTGAMSRSRDEMKEHARGLGGIPQSSVSGSTDYLVCGEKVGASKTQKAEKLGVKVISEQEYWDLAGN